MSSYPTEFEAEGNNKASSFMQTCMEELILVSSTKEPIAAAHTVLNIS